MPLTLPTDTQHVRYESRQYEFFNQPLGQGVSRRKLAIGAVLCTVWIGLMLLLGVPVFSRVSLLIYVAVPIGATVLGTRPDESGRMVGMRWYDWLLSRLPGRLRRVGNPLMAPTGHIPQLTRIDVVTHVDGRHHRRAHGADTAQTTGGIR